MPYAKEASGKRSASGVRSHGVRRFVYSCQARPYTLAIAVTAAVGLLIFGRVMWWAAVSKFKFTTTLTAVTQSFSVRTLPDLTSVWTLPPGTYSTLGDTEQDGCSTKGFELQCSSDSNLKVTISGQAELTWRTTPDGSWTLYVARVGNDEFNISVTNGRQRAIESDQFITYRAHNAALPVRHPFVANEVTVGAELHQSSSESNSGYDFWQPALLSGDVMMIANNKPGEEKYRVLEARLDPGDVIRVGHGEAQEGNVESEVWGVLAIRQEAVSASAAGPAFDVTLHTAAKQLKVSRFGTPDGHVIRASSWSIWRSWPLGQAAWVWFVSLVLILSFVLQLGQVLCDRQGERK